MLERSRGKEIELKLIVATDPQLATDEEAAVAEKNIF